MVTKEVKMMLDPSVDPFAAPAPDAEATPEKFGAKDANDLSWINLLNAYTCTECGAAQRMSCKFDWKKIEPQKNNDGYARPN